MADKLIIWPGNPYPLGALYNGTGVNFSLIFRTCFGGGTVFV